MTEESDRKYYIMPDNFPRTELLQKSSQNQTSIFHMMLRNSLKRDQTSSQSSAISSWPSLVIRCLNSPYLYLRPYPHAGKSSVAIESRKHEASLPKPPFPSAASFSYKQPFLIIKKINRRSSSIKSHSLLVWQLTGCILLDTTK